MSVSGIQNNPYIPQITQTGNANQTGGVGGDGDNDGSAARAGGGRFASAIMQTLSQAGISTGSSAQNPQQALQSFMQSLFAAMQSQAAGTGSDGDNNGNGSSSVSAAGMHGKGGGIGKIEAGLQNLIQQLSSSGSSSSSAGAALQQSFQNLAGTQGSTTLTGFLQSLAQNLQGAGTTGNVVNTLG